jgi:hypothetical protein
LTFVEGKKRDEEVEAVPVRPSAIRLSYNPADVMKMTTQGTRLAPEIRFQDCFVRGRGDMVMVNPSRPFDLEVANALIVLDGSVLHVAGTREDPAQEAKTNQVVKLANVTSYLTGSLLNLQAKNDKSDIPTVVERTVNNLFVAEEKSKRPLITFKGLDSENQMERLIHWEGKDNTYVNFDEKMLDCERSPGINPDQWLKRDTKVVDDESPTFARGKFEREGDRPLSEAVPGDFKTLETRDKVDFGKCGANLENLPKLSTQPTLEDDVTKEEQGE